MNDSSNSTPGGSAVTCSERPTVNAGADGRSITAAPTPARTTTPAIVANKTTRLRRGASAAGNPPDGVYCSVAPNSAALAKRSAGVISSAFATAASMFGGTLPRMARTRVGRSVSSFAISACVVGAVCGVLPDSIS